MTGRLELPWPRGAWRQRLAEAVTDLDELLALVNVTPEAVAASRDAVSGFALRVPRGYVDRMVPGDPGDPLLLQVLPRSAEAATVDGFTADPVGELAGGSTGPVLEKYRGRVLAVTTGACAVHCRYCFRRHFPFGERSGIGDDLLERLSALPEDVEEVILSGGDPLVLTDEVLEWLLTAIESRASVRRLRIHTRTPVVLPERVDDGLLEVLARRRLPVVVVFHANHARELGLEVAAGCEALRDLGLTLLNQSVLLAEVNDSVRAQVDLAERLFDCGVLPYYVHLLDPVDGAAHFEVAEDRARALMAEVAAQLPGYLVPRLVREIPGAPSKTVIAPTGR
jgi:EF-P beta-lysylation protein EpmB